MGCGNSNTDNVPSAADGGQTESPEDTAGTVTDSGKVELKIWVEESQFDSLKMMIESFKKEYAGQAEFEFILEPASDADMRNLVLGDIHNAADVFSLPDDQLFSLIAGGALSPVVNQDTIKADNLEGAVEAASYNGVLYAYPFSADNGYFLYYKKHYFNDADVQTMDRILEITSANEKLFTMELNSGWYLYSFYGNTGMDFGINEDGVTNHCNWNTTEGAIKGVDVAQAILDITTNPGFVAQSDGLFEESITSGDVIAGISGIWSLNAVKNAWGNNYGACKLPTYTCNGQQIQMSSFVGYKMFGVNSYSDHLDWAHKFAEWISNERCQTTRFVYNSQGPSNKNLAASSEVAKIPAIAAIIEQSEYGTLQRVGNRYWDACTSFADVLAAGNPDNTPLQDLTNKLVNDITASIVQ